MQFTECFYLTIHVFLFASFRHLITPKISGQQGAAGSIRAGNDMLKVNNKNTRRRCEICLKLTAKTYFTPCSSVFIVNFEQVIAGWVGTTSFYQFLG